MPSYALQPRRVSFLEVRHVLIRLPSLKTQADDIRARSYAAKTTMHEIAQWWDGMSKKITVLCEEVLDLRAQVSVCRHPEVAIVKSNDSSQTSSTQARDRLRMTTQPQQSSSAQLQRPIVEAEDDSQTLCSKADVTDNCKDAEGVTTGKRDSGCFPEADHATCGAVCQRLKECTAYADKQTHGGSSQPPPSKPATLSSPLTPDFKLDHRQALC